MEFLGESKELKEEELRKRVELGLDEAIKYKIIEETEEGLQITVQFSECDDNSNKLSDESYLTDPFLFSAIILRYFEQNQIRDKIEGLDTHILFLILNQFSLSPNKTIKRSVFLSLMPSYLITEQTSTEKMGTSSPEQLRQGSKSIDPEMLEEARKYYRRVHEEELRAIKKGSIIRLVFYGIPAFIFIILAFFHPEMAGYMLVYPFLYVILVIVVIYEYYKQKRRL